MACCNSINNTPCTCSPACGCSDAPLLTPPPCTTGTPACPTGDKCPETFAAGCTVYTGDTIADLNILKGDRMDIVIQKLALFVLNPGCSYPASCQSVVGVRSTNVSATIIGVQWNPFAAATTYQVQYRATTSGTWLLNPAVASTSSSDMIGGLLPATSYYVRVNTFCGISPCTSLTILVTTTAT